MKETSVSLRPVIQEDVPVFFNHQRDPEAVKMAAFPARELEAHTAHWTKIMAGESNLLRTILVDGDVAGYACSWDGGEGRLVGYWLGREFWGRGVATRALQLYLDVEHARPLFAHVARHNLGSRRVLQKCGFEVVGAAGVLQELTGEPIPELIFRLD